MSMSLSVDENMTTVISSWLPNPQAFPIAIDLLSFTHLNFSCQRRSTFSCRWHVTPASHISIRQPTR